MEWDLADHHRDATALAEAVAAETGEVGDAEGEIELVLLLESLLLVLGENRIGELERVLCAEEMTGGGVGHLSVDSELGVLARDDVQIGCAARDHLVEQRAKAQTDGRRRAADNWMSRRRVLNRWQRRRINHRRGRKWRDRSGGRLKCGHR